MNRKNFFRSVFILSTITFFCLPLINGCGKQGMPSPKKTQDTFALTATSVSAMNNCLVARGTVEGAIHNVDTVSIEVAPIQSFDDCPGCPFVPQEYSELARDGIQLDPKSGQFLFSFCPSTPAPIYRWRLIGKNVYKGLPYATTTPQVLVMEKQ